MEGQSTEEDPDGKLAPAAGKDLTREASPNSSPDLATHSGQISESDAKEAEIRDPGLQENPPPGQVSDNDGYADQAKIQDPGPQENPPSGQVSDGDGEGNGNFKDDGNSDTNQAKIQDSGPQENPSGQFSVDDCEVDGNHESHGDGDTDQAEIQDPGPQENLPPEDLNEPVAIQEFGEQLTGLSFPRKLWRIVENDAFKSVYWNDDGDKVIIEVNLFQREILRRRGTHKIFETDRMKIFIRQLNLYGFSNIRANASRGRSRRVKKTMIYHNYNFQRDQPALLENICKKTDLRLPDEQMTCIPTPLRNPAQQATSELAAKRKRLAPTRRSPRFHHKAEDEANSGSQGEAPSDQGPSSPQHFTFPGVWAMSSVPENPQGNQPLQGPSSPSGEGTSRNVRSIPLAMGGMEGAGEEPKSPPAYPTYESVMSLYNSCYSMLMATLSTLSPRHNPSVEQGESSDYKCAVCEQVKDNQDP